MVTAAVRDGQKVVTLRCSAHDEGRHKWAGGGRAASGLLPTTLSFLDSFLSKIQLPSLPPWSSWCCRNRLQLHRRRNVVAFYCRRVLGSTSNR